MAKTSPAESATAGQDAHRIPRVGDTVHYHRTGFQNLSTLMTTSSKPARVTRACSPGDPHSLVDLELTTFDVYKGSLPAKSKDFNNRMRLKDHWCFYVDGMNFPTGEAPDRLPDVGETVALFHQTADGIIPVPGKVVAVDEDGGVDIEISETEHLPNTRSCGERAPSHGEWSWTPAPAAD